MQLLCFFKTTLIHRSCFTIIVLKGFTKKNLPQTIFLTPKPFLIPLWILPPFFSNPQPSTVPNPSMFPLFLHKLIHPFLVFLYKHICRKNSTKTAVALQKYNRKKTVTNPINLGLQKPLKKKTSSFSSSATTKRIWRWCFPIWFVATHFSQIKKQEKTRRNCGVWCFPICCYRFGVFRFGFGFGFGFDLSGSGEFHN